MTSEEDRKCSGAQFPDATGNSKQEPSKSFRSFFRRKKKLAPRARDHCVSMTETETEYQHRHHGGHYHTVSGTSALGHVIHDQFNRRHLLRAHDRTQRCRTVSACEEDDNDVTPRSDMTSSRRLPGYFRWRYRSANDDVEDDVEQRSTAVGTGGSRVRHWIYSFRQRSRSGGDSPTAITEPPRSRGPKFKVTPTRSISTVEGHDVIGPVQFSEMLRNRTNSDPCFEAWLKAKAAVKHHQVGSISQFLTSSVYVWLVGHINAVTTTPIIYYIEKTA